MIHRFNLNLISEPRNEICGNYKREKDEQCDPGGIVPEDSQCCTKECKLKPKALCRYILYFKSTVVFPELYYL